MSLVAYGSSDESENEEEISETPLVTPKTESNVSKESISSTPDSDTNHNLNGVNGVNDSEDVQLNFNILPQPVELNNIDVKEADNLPLPKKVDYSNVEKPPKKKKGPTKIVIPSLADVSRILIY